MSAYQFQTDQFGINETGIHLLRSGFNYKTIPLQSVEKLSIEKGRQVNNWLLLLIFGLLLLALGLYTGFKIIYEFFFANNYATFYIEQFLFPVLPFLVGLFCIYYSLKTGLILIVHVGDSSKSFPIGNMKRNPKIAELRKFLESNNDTRYKFINEVIETYN